MKISELIKDLENIKKTYGDLETRIGYDDEGWYIENVDVDPEMTSDGEEGSDDICWIMGK
jgi:hypothetical protein